MDGSPRTDADRTVLQWLMGRKDVPLEELKELLGRWRREAGAPGPALATVLIEARRATPEQITQILSSAMAGPAPAVEASSASSRLLSRLPEKAREALQTPSNWFGPSLERGLPKYLLVRLLGQGGMGQVYQAYQTDLERWVALKFLLENDPGDRARFLREARAQGGLSHPNIVRVYEIGEWENRCFIAMEYIEGSNLLGSKLDPRRACELARDAARAVGYAHAQGVVHRDLKPQNLLLSGSGQLYVADFGLARILTPGSTASLTVSGEILGTPSFMAPEQARGSQREIDARTDVYGLGATLYHLLSGRPPFESENLFEIVASVVQKDPLPLRKIVPRIDRDVDVIVMKCLEKDQDRRYGSAEALAQDLERYLAGDMIQARPPSLRYRIAKRIRRQPLLSGAAALIVLLLAAAGGLAVYSGRVGSREEETHRELRCQQLFGILHPFLEAESLPGMALDLGPIRATPRSSRRDPMNDALADEAIRTAVAPSTLFEALFCRARLHLMAGEHKEALALLERAGEIPLPFKPPPFPFYLGYAREMTGDPQGALREYDQAPSQSPRLRFMALVRAGDLRRAAGKLDEARASYERAAGLTSNPDELETLERRRREAGPPGHKPSSGQEGS